jgi:hypothetical protein
MSETEKDTSTLRLETTRIPSLTLRLPRGLDLRVEFVDAGDPKHEETPLAVRVNERGDIEVDCVKRPDTAGCRSPVPPFPLRGDTSGCRGPIPPKPPPPK